MLLTSIFFFISTFLSSISAKLYPLCSSTIRDLHGEIDVQATLYNCSQNIRGSMFPPSYFGNNVQGVYTGPTVVNISSSINTLITVDDVNAQVVLDIYFRMYWKDPRLNLPEEFWGSMNPVVATYEGLEITPYVRSPNALMIWQPDIQIMEAVQVTTAAELMHLFKDGGVFWSRHLLITLTQAQMDLHKYPNDDQFFQMTFQSFSYSDDFVVLAPLSGKGFVSLNTIPSRPGVSALSLNRLWTYNNNDALKLASASSIFFHKSRRFSTVTLNLNFSRQNFGIILRMVLPVAIFMTVVALTFWADIGKRIDITVQMLLVVSSLYFVIGQIIPFVGYFTTFDLFITIFFGLLGVTIALHFIIYQLENLKIKYPIALLLSEGLVFFARLGALPLAMLVGLILFPNPPDYFKIPITILVALVMFAAMAGFPNVIRKCYFALCKMRFLKETREYKYFMKHKKDEAERAQSSDSGGEGVTNKKSKETLIEEMKKDTQVTFLSSAMALNEKISKEKQSKAKAKQTEEEQEEAQEKVITQDASVTFTGIRANLRNDSKNSTMVVPDMLRSESPSTTLPTPTHYPGAAPITSPPSNTSTPRSTQLTLEAVASHNLATARTSSKTFMEDFLTAIFQTNGKKKWKAPDEVSDVETIDTAVEHHQTVAHKPGKMKADEDIAYDLLINQDHLYKHRVENLLVTLCQGVNCCEYHAQLQSLMKEQARQGKEDEKTVRTRKEKEGTERKEMHWQFLSAFCVPCDNYFKRSKEFPIEKNSTQSDVEHGDSSTSNHHHNTSSDEMDQHPFLPPPLLPAVSTGNLSTIAEDANGAETHEVYPKNTFSPSLPTFLPALHINTTALPIHEDDLETTYESPNR